MSKSKAQCLLIVLTLFIPVSYAGAEDVQDIEDAGQIISAPSDIKPAPHADNDEAMEEKDNSHERGMHGMIHGDHATGLHVVIGVVMVLMMAVMIL